MQKNKITDYEIQKWRKSNKVQAIYNDLNLIKAIKSKKFDETFKKIIITANNLLSNKFIFQEKWDMEQTHILYNQGNPNIDWNKMQNDDEEYIFMLNRHTSFLVLAKAYFYTRESKYVKKIKEFFYSWLDSRYTLKGLEGKYNRIIDKGIRLNNWIKTILLIINSKEVTNKFLLDMFLQIKIHIDQINKFYLPHHSLSNHGLIANWGLIKSSYYFADILKINHKDKIIKKVEENARLQILPDGMHWEQSPMYHNWSIVAFLDIWRYSKKMNWKFSKEFLEKIHSLCSASVKFIKPNLHQPMLGDSDDTNIADILTRACIEFQDSNFKYFGLNDINLDILLDYGSEVISKYNLIKSKQPNFTSAFMHESGNYFLRDSWNKDANYLSFKNGQYGSGHGHADDNSISIFANGVDWITNTGRFTYTESIDRINFKSAAYHNSQVVNGEGATIPNGSWTYSKVALNIKQKHFSNSYIDYVSGYNLGFFNSKKSVIPNRKVLFIKPNFWFIYDTFYSKQKSDYEINYHVPNNIDIKLYDKKIQLTKNSKKFYIWKMENLKAKISRSEFSRHYNLREKSNKISLLKSGNLVTNISTILEVGKSIKDVFEVQVERANGKKIDREECKAFKIVISKNNFLIISISNKENFSGKKLYKINGHVFYGKLVIIYFKNNEFKKEYILEY